jgi:hypothetical protein
MYRTITSIPLYNPTLVNLIAETGYILGQETGLWSPQAKV